MSVFIAEHTDTFGGEANYSWFNRVKFIIPDDASERTLVMRAKKELGLTGVRCDRDTAGEMIRLTPRSSCTVIFIYPVY